MIEVIPQMIAFGLINPLVALPAFLLGWMVRRWWLVPVGAVWIAVVLLILSLTQSAVPEAGEIVWQALPVTTLPPLAWCAAGYAFGHWRRSRHGGSKTAVAIRVASIGVGLLIGAPLGAAAGLGLGQAYVIMARVISFEGLSGYVVVFLFALPGLAIGGIAGAAIGGVLYGRLAARRMTAT